MAPETKLADCSGYPARFKWLIVAHILLWDLALVEEGSDLPPRRPDASMSFLILLCTQVVCISTVFCAQCLLRAPMLCILCIAATDPLLMLSIISSTS